MVILPVRVY